MRRGIGKLSGTRRDKRVYMYETSFDNSSLLGAGPECIYQRSVEMKLSKDSPSLASRARRVFGESLSAEHVIAIDFERFRLRNAQIFIAI